MDENPYQLTGPRRAAASSTDSPAKPERLGCLASALLGALVAVIGAYPVAALVAFFYRFPIPFAGYASGFEAVAPTFVAVTKYGAIGGFIVVAALGALAGVLGSYIASAVGVGREGSLYLLACLAVLADLPPVVLLSVLDKIIGHW